MTTFSTFSKSQKMSFWPARAQKADHGTALGRLLNGYKQKMANIFYEKSLFELILKGYQLKAKA